MYAFRSRWHVDFRDDNGCAPYQVFLELWRTAEINTDSQNCRGCKRPLEIIKSHSPHA